MKRKIGRNAIPDASKTSQLETEHHSFALCFLCLALLLTLLANPARSADNNTLLQGLLDRAEIQEVVTRYITALDTRDADLYVSVFTQDAEYDIEGQIVRGHDELRAIITGLQASRNAALADGRAVRDLYHSNLNPSIEIISATEARYSAYWQTLSRTEENIMRIGGMGKIADILVKQNGRWLIQKRTLTNFIVRE